MLEFGESGFPIVPKNFFWKIKHSVGVSKSGELSTEWTVWLCRRRFMWPFYKKLRVFIVDSPRKGTVFVPNRGELTTAAQRILLNHPRVLEQPNRISRQAMKNIRAVSGHYPPKTLDTLFDRPAPISKTKDK